MAATLKIQYTEAYDENTEGNRVEKDIKQVKIEDATREQLNRVIDELQADYDELTLSIRMK